MCAQTQSQAETDWLFLDHGPNYLEAGIYYVLNLLKLGNSSTIQSKLNLRKGLDHKIYTNRAFSKDKQYLTNISIFLCYTSTSSSRSFILTIYRLLTQTLGITCDFVIFEIILTHIAA